MRRIAVLRRLGYAATGLKANAARGRSTASRCKTKLSCSRPRRNPADPSALLQLISAGSNGNPVTAVSLLRKPSKHCPRIRMGTRFRVPLWHGYPRFPPMVNPSKRHSTITPDRMRKHPPCKVLFKSKRGKLTYRGGDYGSLATSRF